MNQLPSSYSARGDGKKRGLYCFCLPIHYFSVFSMNALRCGTQPMAENALKPLCNAEHNEGLSSSKTELLCFKSVLLPGTLLRKTKIRKG